MRKLTIFSYLRDPKKADNIIGKKILRVITVSDSFVGIGNKGEINKSEFQKLADALDPSHEGISIS